jgi:hypothetical protein
VVVSFDGDFDRTDRGRQMPADILPAEAVNSRTSIDNNSNCAQVYARRDIVKCCGSADLERIGRVLTMNELSRPLPVEISDAARPGT